MTSTKIVRADPNQLTFALIERWDEVLAMARSLAESSVFRTRTRGEDGQWRSLPCPAANLALAMLFGAALGLAPGLALVNLRVTPDGTVIIPAQLMRALLIEAGYEYDIQVEYDEKGEPVAAAMTLWRRDDPTRRMGPMRFTMQDAERAGLLRPGGPWEKFPAQMLVARVSALAVRTYAPHVLSGTYLPAEVPEYEHEAVEDTGFSPRVVVVEEETGEPVEATEEEETAAAEEPAEAWQEPYEWHPERYAALLRYAEEAGILEEVRHRARLVQDSRAAALLCEEVRQKVLQQRKKRQQEHEQSELFGEEADPA